MHRPVFVRDHIRIAFVPISLDGTKYVYIKSTTVFVSSSELGPPDPSLASECAPTPRTGGGGHTRLRVRGWGSPNSPQRLEKKLRSAKLALCLLCA